MLHNVGANQRTKTEELGVYDAIVRQPVGGGGGPQYSNRYERNKYSDPWDK